MLIHHEIRIEVLKKEDDGFLVRFISTDAYRSSISVEVSFITILLRFFLRMTGIFLKKIAFEAVFVGRLIW